MKFPTHIYAIGTTSPLHGSFPLPKHSYLIGYKQNPIVMANIIKPTLQMNTLKLTEFKSDAWGHTVVVSQSWKLGPTCLIPGPWHFLPCRVGRRCRLQSEERCNSYFIERQESTDLSKVTHCVSCSETRTRYKVSRICGPSSFPVTTCLARKDGDTSLKGKHLWEAEHVAELSTEGPKSGHQGPIEGICPWSLAMQFPSLLHCGDEGMALASDQLQFESYLRSLLSLRPESNDLTFSGPQYPLLLDGIIVMTTSETVCEENQSST